VLLRPNLTVSVSLLLLLLLVLFSFWFSSNCSRSHASWSRGLDNAKGTQIIRGEITLHSSIKALLLTYLFIVQLKFLKLDIFLTEISLCRLLCRILHVKLYFFTVVVLSRSCHFLALLTFLLILLCVFAYCCLAVNAICD